MLAANKLTMAKALTWRSFLKTLLLEIIDLMETRGIMMLNARL